MPTRPEEGEETVLTVEEVRVEEVHSSAASSSVDRADYEDLQEQVRTLSLRVATLEYTLEGQNTAIDTAVAAQFRILQRQMERRLEERGSQRLQTSLAEELLLRLSTDPSTRATLSASLFEDLSTEIHARVDARVQALSLDLHQEMRDYLQRRLEQDLRAIRISLHAELMAQVQAFLELEWKARPSLDATHLGRLELRIDETFLEWTRREQGLGLRLEEEVGLLRVWVVERLNELKKCLTDREVLMDGMELFARQLRVRLDEVPCVSPSDIQLPRRGAALSRFRSGS